MQGHIIGTLWFKALLAVPALLMTVSKLSGQDKSELQKYLPRLEKNLKGNIMPFWLNKSLDHKNGGYWIDFDAKGDLKPQRTKMIVTQARQVWLFSRLARSGYCGNDCLEAAGLGFRFLRDRMWDPKNGGFWWEVDETGTQRLRTMKHLYGQAFALYALSEYSMAAKNADSLKMARDLFDLLESRAHDKKYGGYEEFFTEDWKPAPPETDSYMGGKSGVKLMNTHLHLLEAMTTFYRASNLPAARERLLELIAIQTSSVVRKDLGACTDKYNSDWTPRLEGNLSRVSYGHDLENVWLVMDACAAAGISTYPYLDLYRSLWNYALKYGFDEATGAFCDSGPFNRPADDRSKVWWVQCEAAVSALYMYRITKDPKYLGIFNRVFGFIEQRLTDWKTGEWHERVTAEGNSIGDKASPWKAGYHNGRAMIESLELIKDLTK